MDSV